MQPLSRSLESVMYRFAYTPPIRRVLGKIPIARRIYGRWKRKHHPFDIREQVDTSGYVGVDEMTTDEGMRSRMIPYAGSSPSIVRAAIESLPDVRAYDFVDLGCGKGRALLVASEYPFRRIIGVELWPALVAIAKRNVSSVVARHPGRSPMEVVQANALEFDFPRGNVVIFMYHALGLDLMTQLTAQIGAAVEDGRISQVFIIYLNPVHAVALDSSQVFKRYYAATHALAEEELGYAFDSKDTVVIWQASNSEIREMHKAHPGADRPVIVKQADWQAALA